MVSKRISRLTLLPVLERRDWRYVGAGAVVICLVRHVADAPQECLSDLPVLSVWLVVIAENQQVAH